MSTAPFAVRHIDHIVLRSIQPQRLIAFYCEALGCRVDHEDRHVGSTYLRAGNAMIVVVDASGPMKCPGDESPSWEQRNLDRFSLVIEPFDPAALELYFSRFQPTPDPAHRRHTAGGEKLSIFVEDPDGNQIELTGSAV